MGGLARECEAGLSALRQEGLSIGSKTQRRKRTSRYRSGRPGFAKPNDCWAVAVMADALFDSGVFKILTVVDCHSRESLAIVPRTNFRAYPVVDILDRLARERGRPRTIRCDNGPEIAGRLLDQRAYLNDVESEFSRPGKLTGNAYVEAFNGRLRAECLNASWFLSMTDARARIESWRIDYTDYNEMRLHTSLSNLTPK